ncbi:MAG TPA: AMP-dependent synthetase, partial [Mycobacterium sp.]
IGGRNVYPAEIESALSAHPNVLSCLVVGVPDDTGDLGQVPHAIVQADGLDEASVIAFLSDRIAGYKVPRTVEFVDSPLRDDAGKARRSAVRADVIARRAAQSG